MNKARQKEVAEIINKLDEVRAMLEEVAVAERDVIEDKSEKWREGQQGQDAQELIDHLDRCIGGIEDIIDTLNGIAPSGET